VNTSMAMTIRKTLARLAAFWQIWRPNGSTVERPPSLPSVFQEPTDAADRLPFDPQDCDELGVFALETALPIAAPAPPSSSPARSPIAPIQEPIQAVPNTFRPRKPIGSPGRREGAGTH